MPLWQDQVIALCDSLVQADSGRRRLLDQLIESGYSPLMSAQEVTLWLEGSRRTTRRTWEQHTAELQTVLNNIERLVTMTGRLEGLYLALASDNTAVGFVDSVASYYRKLADSSRHLSRADIVCVSVFLLTNSMMKDQDAVSARLLCHYIADLQDAQGGHAAGQRLFAASLDSRSLAEATAYAIWLRVSYPCWEWTWKFTDQRFRCQADMIYTPMPPTRFTREFAEEGELEGRIRKRLLQTMGAKQIDGQTGTAER